MQKRGKHVFPNVCCVWQAVGSKCGLMCMQCCDVDSLQIYIWTPVQIYKSSKKGLAGRSQLECVTTRLQYTL